MMRFTAAVLAVSCLVGCGERPPPVGPAAEASTAEVEIIMDPLPTTNDSAEKN